MRGREAGNVSGEYTCSHLFELDDVRVQQVAVVHDLPCDILQVV